MTSIHPKLLLEAIEYSPNTGLFLWRERPVSHFLDDAKWTAQQSCARWNTRYANAEAFATPAQKSGYLTGVFFGRRLFAHRAAWAISFGEWPELSVDHKNGVRTDNRLDNLRLASRQEQSRNTSSAKNSTSRFLGVSWRKERALWRANIFIDGRQTFLGSFASEVEAAKAYDAAAAQHFGDFSRLNFP